MPIIDSFSGEYRWMSNFYLCDVMYEGGIYQSSEHAYQAAKTLSHEERALITKCTSSGKAKRAGQTLTIRSDWSKVCIGIMYQISLDKYIRNHFLRQKLLQTGDAKIIEGNTWGDTFWGVCNGVGENHLGEILMDIRGRI